MANIFLTARWENLIMANYTVDPGILKAHLPEGVELDTWGGEALVSLVGFMFLDTKVRGLGIPFHRNFEEVNLRFYVRRREEGEWRRGVVFISELVPRQAIAWVARHLYGEPYRRAPMAHRRTVNGATQEVAYSWRLGGRRHELAVRADLQSRPIGAGSAEEFIFEHYWGYTQRGGGATTTYQVEHPRWNVFPVRSYEIDCDFSLLYGPEWQPFLDREPHSVFLADGSEVQVRQGVPLGARG
jgi:uncharacterized protein YqjF (DUF2071 family)